MADDSPINTQLMIASPGVERDGTMLYRTQHIDSQWCRWYQSRPRKMLGFKEQLRTMPGITRAIDIFSSDGLSYVHLASGQGVYRYTINTETSLNSELIDRTPAGFLPNPQINWQLAEMYNEQDTTTNIFASPTTSLRTLSSTEEFPIYTGDIVGEAPLVAVPGITTSGGVCAVGPYLFVFGHDGIVRWSMPGNPLDFTGEGSGDSRPVPDKIVRAMPLRGQTGPTIIMWSLSSVIIGSYVGGALIFDFTTPTTNGSILSSNGVVEHEGIYYWATTSGFSMFNGVVRELLNDDNKQWFLDNVNFTQRQKVFAFKIPRWNEIWWCFPFGDATECTHAIIYNWVEKCWYDTVLPNGGRSAAYYEFIFAHPIMTGVVPNLDAGGGTSVWEHESGLDEVGGKPATAKAVRSYYRTNEFSVVEPQQAGALGKDRSLQFSLMEPDFEQKGALIFTAISRANARAAEIATDPIFIPEKPPSNNEQLVEFLKMGRLTSFVIESNEVGGNYTSGSPLIHWQPGDGRRQD
jgi:hypothetical protein